MKTLFLINPRSGRRRDYDVATLIRESCANWPAIELRPCGSKDELDGMIDSAERDGFDVVYAVGGDGTVHEVAKRLVDRPLALGILPIGSGNGFARHLGLPLEPRASLAACCDGQITTIDTATVNDNAFLGVMGVGFDAFVAERFASSEVRGMQTYVREGVAGFTEFHAEEYEITVDGAMTKRRALVVAVANSSQYGNNARIAPLASLQDGLLDVVIINDASLLATPFLIARLFSGSLHKSPDVTTLQGRSVLIRRAAAGAAHLDGEPVVLPELLDIRIKPRSLRVLVPQGAAKL